MTLPPAAPRVLVTREEPAALADAVARAGGNPVLLPLLVTRWLAFELPGRRAIEDYDWVAFTSARGLEALARRAHEQSAPWPPATRAAAVGDRTAHELQAQGWMPECTSESSTAAGLVECMLQQNIFGARILFPCSAIAEGTLPDGLRRAGASVDVVPVYTTESAWVAAPEQLPFLTSQLAAALSRGCIPTCASPSAVRALVDLASAAGVLDVLRRSTVAVLGPTTATTARDHGLRAVEADGRTLACLARKAVELGRSVPQSS